MSSAVSASNWWRPAGVSR